MALQKLLPHSFAKRLMLMTSIAGIVPIVIFALLIHVFSQRIALQTTEAIEQGQYEQWQRSSSILGQMAEDIIRQKALDVALQLDIYLLAHPHMDVVSLQKDPFFREIAIQAVGKTGYTAVQDSEKGINRFHRDTAIENSKLQELSQNLPEFWSIMKQSLNGRYAQGYYFWREEGGFLRNKYMYIAPLSRRTADGVLFSVSATTYIDEFTNSLTAARDVSQGSVHLMDFTINKLMQKMRSLGFFFMGVSIFLVSILAAWIGIYISKTIAHLRDAIQSVNEGDYSIQLKSAASGDVANLVMDFNQMINHLAVTTVTKERLEKKEQQLGETNRILQKEVLERKKVEAKLKNHYSQLEELVESRSRELFDSNLQLLQEAEERKQAVEALEASEQRLTAILHASPVGIAHLTDRQFCWVNDTMCQMVGYEKYHLIDADVRMIYEDDEEYERVGRELYEQSVKFGTGVIATQLLRQDGKIIDCVLRGYLLDRNDISKGIIVSIADVSESKKLEMKLQRSQKMETVGELAGGVAHDLNNILSGIVTYPELLLLDMSEDSPLRKPLVTIKRSGERAAAVVQDLLIMARRGVAVTEIVNINDIIRSLLVSNELKKLKQDYPEVTITIGLDDDLPNIRGAVPHLSKTLLNLIINGAESISGEGRISITTSVKVFRNAVSAYEKIKEGEYVALAVADTGSGMAEDQLRQIFEPFYTTKKLGRKGTGLGMAVVWGTVKDHYGYIDVETLENQGSAFTLYIPVCSEKSDTVDTSFIMDEVVGVGQKIVVVDDSETQRVLAREILEKLNYSVSTLKSGEEAVSYLHKHDANLLILDMIMDPGIDGLETYLQISRFKPDQKVLIASGYSETDRVREIQRMSGCEYIRKPYTIEMLGRGVKNALENN